MKASRWQLIAACAAVAVAVLWALWPRPAEDRDAREGVLTTGSRAAARPASGVAGAALREAVGQSGAPGGTPPLQGGGTAADGFVEVRVLAQGKPRPGAHVRLYLRGPADRSTGQVDWRFAGTAETGGDGVARIAARPGTYLAAARAQSFAPARVEFRRPSGERTTKVLLELQPSVSISGRTVQKGTQEPVPLALVTLLAETSRRPDAPTEEQARATSDTLGRFRIDGLQPGHYRAAAQAAGYAKGAARIDASASKEITLELAQASFIEGRVIAADGKPAAGAELFASGGEEAVTGVAGETGSFSLEVAPRSWNLSARRGDDAGRAPGPVAVAAGATARGVEIRLGAASGISGMVVAAGAQQPVPGAQIAVSPHGSNGDLGRAASDASGAFAVRGLAPGSYDVGVSADGYLEASRRGVTVRQGQSFPLRVELRRTGTVEGVVLDGAGRPVPWALVRGAAGEARGDESGAYRLAGVPPGRGSFTALRDGSALGTSASADVPEGATAHLDFQLRDEGVVTGHVRRADGSPPPSDAAVSVSPAGGRMSRTPDFSSVPIDAGGVYVASLPAGAYSIGLQGPRFGGGFRNRSFVTVEPGKTATQDLTWADAVQDAQGFSGLVLEPDGTPSPGASVRVSGRGAGFFFATTTDEQGGFRIDRPRADLPDSFDLVASNGGRSGKVTVLPQQAAATIQLQGAATLHGHLSGGGADSFRVDVTPTGQGMGFGGGGRSTQSLEFAGDRFEIGDLPGLPVHLVVTTQDGRSASLDVQLSPGAVQEVEIPLQPLATLTGRLFDALTQEPLADVQLSIDTRAGDVSSGADGRFQLSAPAGSHKLRGFLPRFRPLSKDFSVQAGQALDLGDVPLQRMTAQPGTIGLSLRGDSDTPPTVVFLIPDGPAEKAGLQLGDQIAAVDGQPVAGVPDAQRRIQGAPGTPVLLSVQRSGTALQVAVTRAP